MHQQWDYSMLCGTHPFLFIINSLLSKSDKLYFLTEIKKILFNLHLLIFCLPQKKKKMIICLFLIVCIVYFFNYNLIWLNSTFFCLLFFWIFLPSISNIDFAFFAILLFSVFFSIWLNCFPASMIGYCDFLLYHWDCLF